MNKQLLQQLCNANGISGDEGCIRDIIVSHIENSGATYSTDSMGNLIVFKKGKKTPDKKLLISAHMDEVGLIISDITDDGYLKFKTVGGIDERVLISKKVCIGKDKIPGVIGIKAIHLQKKEEREKVPDGNHKKCSS